jgi:hypothetical protein
MNQCLVRSGLKPHYVSLPLLFALILTGCATANFSPTGTFKTSPRDENCDFVIYTTSPRTEFEELGVVDINQGWSGVKTMDKVRELAHPYVCQNGGNGLLVWGVHPGGFYTKATVIYIRNKK